MGTDPLALWVLPVSDVGGVGRHVLDVARTGVPGHRLAVALPEGPVADELRAVGTPVWTGALDPGSGIPAGVRALRSAVTELRPQLLHSHLSYADLLVALAGHGATRVSTEHGIARDDLVYHGSPAKARIKALAHTARVRRFHRLVAVSASTREQMVAKWHVHQPISVILNGVDRPATAPTKEPGARFLSLSRLAPEKRIDDLLAAFAVVHRQRPEARLTVAGDGPLRAELTATAARLGVTDAVEFPGVVDATQAMAGHDVVVQLSVWENASYTLLDAVVAGLGVVATPVGGNPEILPERCLTEATLAPDTVASLMLRQADDLAQRPTLTPDWPTVAEMTAALSGLYAQERR